MQLIFLGTGAGAPSLQRNVSALVLSLAQGSENWLFDCGEATQHQYMRSSLKAGKLSKIFITHLHGDHIFGLPGLLTSRSMSGINQPLTIYGPVGIRMFVETALQLSASWASFPLQIIEIEPGVIFQHADYQIRALLLNHVIPCFGYRIEFKGKAGALDGDKLRLHGIPSGSWMQQLKRGEQVTLPDGRQINGQDYTGEASLGRIITILGDTAPCDNALILARQADVLVHEATLKADMAEKANSRGHSTTLQAAQVAADSGAKRLIATHFSSRYTEEHMTQLLQECQSVFANTELARDFRVFEI